MPDVRDATTHTHTGRVSVDVEPGRRLGRYRLGTLLGSGGMGAVFSADDPSLNRTVAIKVLRHTGRSTDAETLRLRREAQALARLRHPNVVSVYESGIDDGCVWIAMEFVDGGTLAQWAREHPPGGASRTREALRLLQQAGEGLAAAHEVGLVHRDFKPANVLIGNGGRVRVADFGLARAQRRDVDDSGEQTRTRSGDVSVDPDVTAAGRVVGTPRYMSPEQRAGADIDARSDQFSFCVTAWEVLFAAPPFGSDFEPNPVPHGPAVPGWVARVLRKGMARRPSQRFDKMPALLEALDPGRRRTRAVVRGCFALTATVVLGTLAHEPASPVRVIEDPCADDRLRAEFGAVWNDERGDALRAAVMASEQPYAGDVIRNVDETLAAYGDAWVSTRRRTCVSLSQARASIDGRTACLRDVLHGLDAWLTNVESSRVDVSRVVEGVDRLDWPDVCASADDRPSRDDARVRELRARLAEADATGLAGSEEAALQLASAIANEASEESVPLIRADALRSVGTWTAKLGDLERGAKFAEQAYEIAAAEGDWRRAAGFAADVTSRYAHLESLQRARPWLRSAEVALARANLGTIAKARYLLTRGDVETAIPDLEAAEASVREALTLLEADDSPQSRTMKETTTSRLATIVGQRGRSAEELLLKAELVRSFERRLGRWHPNTAGVTLNLGVALFRAGRLAEARTALERARAAFRRAQGQGQNVALSCEWLIEVLLELGDLEGAVEALEEAEAAIADADPIRRSEVARARPAVLLAQREFARALASLEAIAVDPHVDAQHNPTLRAFLGLQIATAAGALGNTALAEKEIDASIRFFARAGLVSTHAWAWRLRASIAKLSNDHGAMLQALRRAESLARGVAEDSLATRTLAMQALPLAALGRIDDAQAAIDAARTSATRDEPTEADIHYAQAAVYHARGQDREARAEIVEAVRSLPPSVSASLQADQLLELAAELGLTPGEIEGLRASSARE